MKIGGRSYSCYVKEYYKMNPFMVSFLSRDLNISHRLLTKQLTLVVIFGVVSSTLATDASGYDGLVQPERHNQGNNQMGMMPPNPGYPDQQDMPQQPFMGNQEGQYGEPMREQMNPQMQYPQEPMMNPMEGQQQQPVQPQMMMPEQHNNRPQMMMPEQHNNRPQMMGNYPQPTFGYRGQQQQPQAYPGQFGQQYAQQYGQQTGYQTGYPKVSNAYQNPSQAGQPMTQNFQEEMTARMMSVRNYQNKQPRLEQPMYE